MKTIYQPAVIERAVTMVDLLDELGFFEEYEIENKDFALEYLCNALTEKFISNGLDDEEPLFNEEEMDKCIAEIVAGSYLTEMKENGILDSIEDENNEERFFLTPRGKRIAKQMKKRGDFDELV